MLLHVEGYTKLTLYENFSIMVSLRQFEVLYCILDGSSSLNQDGISPQRMATRTRSEEQESFHNIENRNKT